MKILQKLIPALKPGARIVINDSLVPEPGTLPLLAEKEARYRRLILCGLSLKILKLTFLSTVQWTC